MPGEKPYFIVGKVVEIIDAHEIACVKVPNGNIYHLRPSTPGIDFYHIAVDMVIRCEITSALTRVLSASIISDESNNH
jgi:hypothetical protein